MNAEWLILDTFCSKQNVVRMLSEFLILCFAESIARYRGFESGSDITTEKKNCAKLKILTTFWSHSAFILHIAKENLCISSATLQKDKFLIQLNSGRILYSVKILIVSKLMQKESFYEMQN